MLGIKKIASYLPERKISNYDRKDKFNVDDNFIENKIGVKCNRVKKKDEKTSDLCIKAYNNLKSKISIEENLIDCIVVVTQNPDFNIPHTSAILHGKLKLKQDCACFDISLGCSGYVYGLANIIAFMEKNKLKNGLLFTADPYSNIIDYNDKDTALIFSDAASVTYINKTGELTPIKFSFGTLGIKYNNLICNDKLYMNGREIFNFVVKTIPIEVKKFLEENGYEIKKIDKFIFHQASKYVIDILRKRLKLDEKKMPFDIYNYGNTVSSSIPILLEKEMENKENRAFLISGFGVGLSWGIALLKNLKRSRYENKS